MTSRFNNIFRAFVTEKFNFKTENSEILYNNLIKEKYGNNITCEMITSNVCNGIFVPSAKKLFKTREARIDFEPISSVPDIHISNNARLSARFSCLAWRDGMDVLDPKIIQKITENWSPCFVLKSPLLYNVFTGTNDIGYSINDEDVFVAIYNGYTLINKTVSPIPYISPQKDFYTKKYPSSSQPRHFLISSYIDDGGKHLNTLIKHAHRETELADLVNF